MMKTLTPTTCVEDAFDDLAREETPRPQRKMEFPLNPPVLRLIRGLKAFHREYKHKDLRQGQLHLSEGEKRLRKHSSERYSAHDIEAFMVAVSHGSLDTPSFVTSPYLNWVVSRSTDSEITLNLHRYNEESDFPRARLGISCSNSHQIITVEGECDIEGVKGGVLRINGDVDLAGRIDSGTLAIRGNCARWLGYEMRGGTIILYGNYKRNPGEDMRGGQIHIYGDESTRFEGTQRAKGGAIYFHGEEPPTFPQRPWNDCDSDPLIDFHADIYHKGKKFVWKDGREAVWV